jgi:hypothetical protein
MRTRLIEAQHETEAPQKMATRSVTCADAGALVYIEAVTFGRDDDVMPSVDKREIIPSITPLGSPVPLLRFLDRVRGPVGR